MADEVERVEYEFVGDVSSLKSASSTAIDLLQKYSDSIKRAATTDAFAASKKSTASMNASLNRLGKDLTKIQDKLKGVGDVKLPTGSAPMQAMTDTLRTLSNQFERVSTSSNLTSKDMKELRSQVEAARATIQSSAPAVDKLVDSEQRFQNVLGAVQSKVDKFRQVMENTKGSLNNAFSPIASKLQVFSTLFDGISQKVQSFKDKAAIAFSRVSQLADTCASAFRRNSQEADKDKDAHSSLSSLLDKLTAKFKKTSDTANEAANATKKQGDAAKKATAQNKGLTAALGALSGGFGKVVKAGLSIIGGVKVGEWLSNAAKQSINLTENLNLFSVAMGKSLDKGLQFVDAMQEIYGMDPSNIYRYAGYFYQLTDAIGMADEASASLSLSMTKAANDIASLFNQDIETVVNNLASGMQGMSRAVRKYGMDIRATTLQQTALAYGITEQVESMSEANRMALRYITMMNQVRNATQQVSKSTKDAGNTVGDFANNIETPANQLRIFKEQITQLGRAIGNFFVVPLGKALAYINGFIMALRMAINFIGSLLGIVQKDAQQITAGSDLDGTAKSISGIGSAAKAAKKQMDQLVAPFDELNILQEQQADSSGGGGGLGTDTLDPNLLKALQDMELSLDNIRMKANKVRDAILEFLGFKVDAGKILGWDYDTFIENLKEAFNTLPKWFQDLVTGIVDIVRGIVEPLWGNIVKPVIDTIISGIRYAFETLRSPISDLFSTLFADLKDIVYNDLKPAIEAVGNFLKPVLLTVSSLWQNVINMLSATVSTLQRVWSASIKPILDAAFLAVQNLFNYLGTAWESIIGPLMEYIGAGLETLWNDQVLPICELIIDIVGNIVEIILGLWNNVLIPIVTWLTTTFGPTFSKIFQGIWSIVQSVFTYIGNIIQGLLQALKGLTDFLAGVFTKDWTRAWKGLVNVFIGLGNAVLSAAEGVINGIITLVNKAIAFIYNAVVDLINALLDGLSFIMRVLGIGADLSIGAPPPQIPTVSFPRIPLLAQGGVVDSPTMAMIGEGQYDEAVIPLGNSPQMQDLVQQIADAVNKPDDNAPQPPVEVRVYIGGKEWDAEVYQSARRGATTVGAQPVKENK